MPIDPIARFRRWFDQARGTRVPLPEAMALATTGADGRPSVRFVLLKEVDRRGFAFFTDARSRKGRELRESRRAAAVFYWDRLGKQVRVEGPIEEVSALEADAYWETRPRPSRLAALASMQSAPLPSRARLTALWRRLGREYRGKHIPRPRNWTGFRVIPEAIEFWIRGDDRLHHRELFRRTRRGWERKLLQP